MIPATIQQLSVVERKATKLEQQVANNIETLKAAKTERDDAEARVLELRRLLEEETLRAEKAHVVHEKAESMLRHSAGEYRKAQLLQKKLLNTLKELQGFNRSVVLVEGGGASLFSQPVMNNDANAGALRVADHCTIHIPSMRKTIVVDSIVSPPTMQDHHPSSLDHNNLSTQDDTTSSSTSALLIPSLVGEALGGYNISIIVIGPKGAGKSASTWGVMREENGAGMHRGNRSFNISPQNSANKNAISDPSGFLLAKYFRGFDSYFGHQTNKPSAEGPSKGSSTAPPALVPLFMHHLFTHFATYDVTHFNIRITFVELVADGTVDLFVVPGHSLGILPESATMPIGISGDDREHDANGNAHPSSALYMASQRAVSMQVRTEEEFYEALRHAFANRAHRLSAKHRAASDEAIRSNSRRTSGVASQGGVAHPATSLAPHKLADLYGGHLALSVHIENFNARGNFRRSTVLFTDVAGGLTLDKSSAEVGHAERSRSGSSAIERSQQQTTDQIWAAKGAWALTDVISMASAAAATSVSQSNNSTVNASRTTATTMTATYVTNAAQAALANLELPHQANRLVQLVKEGFGGNAKGVLYCVVPPCSSFPTDPEGLRLSNQNAEPSETPGEIRVASLNALAYAHYFKGTCHNAIPLDVPPELQQLTREVGGDDGDYYDEGEPDNWANNEEEAYRSSHQNDHGLQTSLPAGVRGGPPLGRV